MPVISLANPTSGGWTVTGSISHARMTAAAGTADAALAFGGYDAVIFFTLTEKFNGSAWSAVSGGNLGTGRTYHAGVGTQDAALTFGGMSPATLASAEKFNGSTWSSTGSLSGARFHLGAAGTQDAALAIGGSDNAPTAVTEKFNGSTWSTVSGGNLTSAKQQLRGVGTQNAALAFGGYDSAPTAVTEKFNGSTWSTVSGGNLSAAKRLLGGAGTQDAALAFGGSASAPTAVTEKFNGSTWSSTATSLSAAREAMGAAGTQDAALAVGGYSNSAVSAVTEKYTGSSGASPSLSVAEGVLANGNVATLSASEAGMAFSLVAGDGDTDNASFNISGSDLISLSELDFESQSSYSVRINATNGTTTYQNVVNISVTNVNEAPSNITLSASSIQEGNAIGDVVGTLAAIDPDTGDTAFTFSLVSGGDKFSIDGDSLKAAAVFDYEVATSHSITVRAEDAGGASHEKAFVISVVNDVSDDTVSVDASQVVSGTGGKVAVVSANNPVNIPFLLNGNALPVGSLVRWSGNSNQKFFKISGNSQAFKAIPLTPPVSWKWSAAGDDAWEVLQGF